MLSQLEQIRIIEYMWQVAYADGYLSVTKLDDLAKILGFGNKRVEKYGL